MRARTQTAKSTTAKRSTAAKSTASRGTASRGTASRGTAAKGTAAKGTAAKRNTAKTSTAMTSTARTSGAKTGSANSGLGQDAAVDAATQDALAMLALGQADVLTEAAGLRGLFRKNSGLDPRSFALVKIAALIAVDAPPASYLWQVQGALDAGVMPREILGVLAAIAPQVGVPKVLAAAPEIMVALDLELPAEMEV